LQDYQYKIPSDFWNQKLTKLKPITLFAERHSLIPKNSTIVLGLSGGPDSIFLLQFLCYLRDQGIIKQIIAAHLDHGWRADSANDVAFCKQAAQKANVPFATAHISDYTHELPRKGSKEELGRYARRLFLEQVMQKHQATAIALAHHLQDQEETFLIRLIRGTSLTGLCAMWPKRGAYIRPLLETNKRDILQYLDEHQIPYLIDPTNESPSFLRNRIRTNVVPGLHESDDRFDANFLSTLNRLQAIETYLAQHTHELLGRMTHQENGHLALEIPKLLELPTIMQYRILMEWLQEAQVTIPTSQQFLDEILRFLGQPESKSHEIHHQWLLHKKKNLVWIENL